MNRKLKKRYKLLSKYVKEILKVAPEFNYIHIYPHINMISCHDANDNRVYIFRPNYCGFNELAVSDGKRVETIKEMNFHKTHFLSKNDIGTITTELLQKLEEWQQ